MKTTTEVTGGFCGTTEDTENPKSRELHPPFRALRGRAFYGCTRSARYVIVSPGCTFTSKSTGGYPGA
jgi:hypothetical protein